MADRNSNARYELAPQVEIERSTIPRPCNVKTSFNVGELVPFYFSEIVPGDSVKIETAKALRLQTLISPVMDNLYLDTYYFFVPNRIIWEHWEELCGANKTSAWVPSVEYTVPQVVPPNGGWEVGSIADYFGVIPGVYSDETSINALPFRAYAKCVDDWFRDQNLMQPINIPTGDAVTIGSNGSNYVTDLVKGGKPFVACKYHDLYTSCLPAPLKASEPVTFLPEFVPVVPRTELIDRQSRAVQVRTSASGVAPSPNAKVGSVSGYLGVSNLITEETNENVIFDAALSGIYPANLWAKNSGTTINDLRMAFQLQRIFERDARSGNRMQEILAGHFGVTAPDARLQRAEYLGGNRVPFNIEQVLQTSSTDDVTPQGNVSGWSLTNDDSFDVDKSFVEHGYIIGLMCARYDHSYQQNMDPTWFRKRRFDYYWPALAHLGEQAILSRNICWTGTDEDKNVFGYQEAWAEYRYQPNYITGMMRTAAAQSMDFWHFGDWYWDDDQNIPDPPVLSAAWIQEDKSNVDRCLAVTSAVSHQIFGDIMVKATFTRPMPLYSIPGLADHF